MSPGKPPISMKERSQAKANSASVPAKQLPGSISATSEREVRSTRFKRASSSAGSRARASGPCWRRGRRSKASTRAGSPWVLKTSTPISGSLRRRCRMASSSSRASRSGQNAAPSSSMASAEAGGGAARARDGERGAPRVAVDLDPHARIDERIGVDAALDRRQGDALARRLADRTCAASFLAASFTRLLELGVRRRLVDEPPLHGACALARPPRWCRRHPRDRAAPCACP